MKIEKLIMTRGQFPNRQGVNNSNAKYNNAIVSKIKAYHKRGYSIAEIARHYRFPTINIYSIVIGKLWPDVKPYSGVLEPIEKYKSIYNSHNPVPEPLKKRVREDSGSNIEIAVRHNLSETTVRRLRDVRNDYNDRF